MSSWDGKNLFVYQVPPLRLGLFDLGGVLHHANYLGVLEQTREAFLAACNLSYSELAASGGHLALSDSNQKFIRPVRFGQQIEVHLTAREIRRTRLALDYALKDSSSGETLQTASTTLVFVQEKDGILKPGRLPEKLVKILSTIS